MIDEQVPVPFRGWGLIAPLLDDLFTGTTAG